jgi:hypothetical protein
MTLYIVFHYSDGLDVEHRNLILDKRYGIWRPFGFLYVCSSFAAANMAFVDRDTLRNAGPRVELLCNIAVFPLFSSSKPFVLASGADGGIAVVTHLLRPRS